MKAIRVLAAIVCLVVAGFVVWWMPTGAGTGESVLPVQIACCVAVVLCAAAATFLLAFGG